MKPMLIVLLVVVVLVGGWFVAKDKRAQTQSDGVTSQVEDVTPTGLSSGTAQSGASAGTPLVSTSMTLVISSPADGATVSQSSVTIRGKTKAYAEVFVNDEETIADANGSFSVTLALDEGDNPIVVSANDADGNVVEDELIVYYDAP